MGLGICVGGWEFKNGDQVWFRIGIFRDMMQNTGSTNFGEKFGGGGRF